ncbi:hypothetical protein Hanom_Chr00s001414g01681791 [Helianthus anomalus]
MYVCMYVCMVRVRHFEFVSRTMHIEPTVPRFLVFHQMHCSQGFYYFVQRASTKKILLQPPKSFHDWKQKFFFMKVWIKPAAAGKRVPPRLAPGYLSFGATHESARGAPRIQRSLLRGATDQES